MRINNSWMKCHSWPCYGSGGLSSAPHRGGPGSRPGQSMWDLWCTKWHWDRVFSEFFCFPLSALFNRRSPHPYHLGDEQYVRQWQHFNVVVSLHVNKKLAILIILMMVKMMILLLRWHETKSLWNGLIVYLPHDNMSECGVPVEWCWHGKPKNSEKSPVSMPLCPAHIQCGLPWPQIRTSVVRTQRLTAWAMVQRHSLLMTFINFTSL
jgi:hypothetical protein